MKSTLESHPIAQALVAGLLQGLGERDQDEAMIDAGNRLAIRSVAAAAAIGFTGTRFGMTQAQQDALRSLLLSGSGKLHHGDCVGADEQAHDIARALGRTVVIHPASLPEQRAFKSAQDIREPKAPLVRNKVIVRETDASHCSARTGHGAAPVRHMVDGTLCAQAGTRDLRHPARWDTDPRAW